jgi:hypothetical protein
MLWQGFAFQSEPDIDRAAAKHRCMAYLRSVFPREFGRVSLARLPLPLPCATLSGRPSRRPLSKLFMGAFR